MFPTKYSDILEKIEQIDPTTYQKTRNFVSGAVTKLSPYISRGVISTKMVYESLMRRGYNPNDIEKIIAELSWRDYFQRVWQEKGDKIHTDLRSEQQSVKNHLIPDRIVQGNTQIEGIDIAIKQLYDDGYMHNHVRMYLASIACNIMGSHWSQPARWMYYHLLDGDLASNALSWQWVAGSNSAKKYFANQENINKYTHTKQSGTFLDVSYHEIYAMKPDASLSTVSEGTFVTHLPKSSILDINQKIPLCVYNYYQLDPVWKQDISANRILLLEPSMFDRYPVSDSCIQFVLSLAKNIENIQIYVGEFSELQELYNGGDIYYKEHPLSSHYHGTQGERDWICPEVSGYYPSFFGYWKRCKKQLGLTSKKSTLSG